MNFATINRGRGRVIACIAVFVIIAVCAHPLSAKERPRLAVLNLDAREGVSRAAADTVTDLLIEKLHNTNLFIMVERGNIKQVLKEQAFQQSGCTDTDCAVKIGQLVAANKILVGTVLLLGSKYVVSVRIIDVEKGRVMVAASDTCYSMTDMNVAVGNVVDKMAEKFGGGGSGGATVAKRPTRPGSYPAEGIPSFIPGIGQFFSGRYVGGSLHLGAFLLFMGGYASARSARSSAEADYSDVAVPYITLYMMNSMNLGLVGMLFNMQRFDNAKSRMAGNSRTANGFMVGAAVVYIWSLFDSLVNSSPALSQREKTWRVDFAVLPERADFRVRAEQKYMFGITGRF